MNCTHLKYANDSRIDLSPYASLAKGIRIAYRSAELFQTSESSKIECNEVRLKFAKTKGLIEYRMIY